MFEKLVPFLISTAIGLMIGVEREQRNVQTAQATGVRTFVLMALLGALAGSISEPFIALALAVFAGFALLLGYLRTSKLPSKKKADIGLTTEMAAAVVFGLGYLANFEPLLSVILGTLVLLVLVAKAPLHRFSKSQLRPKEIQAAAILFALVVGVLPLIPDVYIDPWGIFNLRRFVLIVAVIGGIQFAAYASVRFWGSKAGVPLTGLLAGLVSSTAAFFALPKLVKEKQAAVNTVASAALLASVATLCELLVVIALASLDVLALVFLPVFAAIVVGSVVALVLAKKNGTKTTFPEPSNPLSILSCIKLAILLFGLLALIGVIQHFLGPTGTLLASFVAGLGELQGASLAAATLFAGGEIEESVAVNAVMLATLGSMLSKLIIIATLTKGRYAIIVGSTVFAMAAAQVTLWVVL